jgi:hypothetical protein
VLRVKKQQRGAKCVKEEAAATALKVEGQQRSVKKDQSSSNSIASTKEQQRQRQRPQRSY